MSASSDAVAKLDRLLVDDPYQPGIDELMLVAGDLLQARGHPRGELIAYERALAHATRETRDDHAAALARWLHEHLASVLGQAFVSFSAQRGALRYEFRGGRLRGLFIDTRRIEHEGLGLASLIVSLLGSHGVRELVELRVRVRRPDELAQVGNALKLLPRKPPLELVSASTTTRPLGHQQNGEPSPLRGLLPYLWFATHAGRIVRTQDRGVDFNRLAAELDDLAGAPLTRELRVHVGRALSSGHKRLTEAGLRRIAELGESGRVFAPALRMLISPIDSPAARWVLPALPRLGAWARELEPAVARMTGDPRRYGGLARSAAGRCLHGFAQASAAVDLADKPSQARG